MKYFSIRELTKSDTAKRLGIPNIPSQNAISNLHLLVLNILDPLREAWGAPIIVSSGYRSKKLNEMVGGDFNSQHLYGQAADIRTLSDEPEDNKKLFDLIISMDLPYDQLIDEYGYNWIHVSFNKIKNRKQVLHKK